MSDPHFIPQFDGSITTHMRSWIEQALAATTYPLAHFDMTVTYTATDALPVPRHDAYMCTVTVLGGNTATTYIKTWADQRSSADLGATLTGYDLQLFFMESIIHELMHAAQGSLAPGDPALAAICGCFEVGNPPTGIDNRQGTESDFDPDGAAWEDRIQEAIAEAGKDLWMPGHFRYYDNRTNWNLIKADL